MRQGDSTACQSLGAGLIFHLKQAELKDQGFLRTDLNACTAFSVGEVSGHD